MILQFQPFESAVDNQFWQSLAKNKIDDYQIDDSTVQITGTYKPGSSLDEYAIPARLMLSSSSFTPERLKSQIYATGYLRNTNTFEEFRNLDKNLFLKTAGLKIWNSITSGDALKHPEILSLFTLLTFADLKKFKFYYWFAFPAILPDSPFTITGSFNAIDTLSNQKIVNFSKAFVDFKESFSSQAGFFLFKELNDETHEFKFGCLDSWDTFWKDVETDEITVGFVDPSGLSRIPGWPLRNFLLLIQHQFKLQKVRVFCLREDKKSQSLFNIIILDVLLSELPANTAIDLNLKLMRWRILPELNLDIISSTKCLLLGSGTLGCHVARILLAWGVRNITFVDNGKVSFSNPVRQPLFTFKNCLDGGKSKSDAAAQSLRDIFPGVNAQSHDLSIPMPGHHINSEEKTLSTIENLTALIQDHDAIFLLTDSRESRWLPTLLGAFYQKVLDVNKIVINAALGFDSFLVIRHGMRKLNDSSPGQLGCYFCNDVVAARDVYDIKQVVVQSNLGPAMYPSAIAVELLASILNHPDGYDYLIRAWAKPESDCNDTNTASPLGVVPHQIRGYLSSFKNLMLVGSSYDKCTACSNSVLGQYSRDKNKFVLHALSSPDYLERVSGLDTMKEDTEAVAIDWEDDSEFQ